MCILHIAVYARKTTEPHGKKRRNFIWFTPSATSQINGVAVGLAAVAIGDNHQQINGVNIEATVACLVLPFFLGDMYQTVNLPVYKWQKGKIHSEEVYRFFYWTDSIAEVINGINVSLGSLLAEQQVNGLTISVLGNQYVRHCGLSISGISNWFSSFDGVCIAPFGNVSRRGSGIQLGLVNSCGNCSGIQIGLINQNGSRITPFLGYRSKSKAKQFDQHPTPIKYQSPWFTPQFLFFTRSQTQRRN